MENSPSRFTRPNNFSASQPLNIHNMATLAASPAPHAGFQKEFPWDNSRFPSYPPKPASDCPPISLPSIRMAFPELHLPTTKPDVSDLSSSPRGPGLLTSPSYTHTSSNKRRRESLEDEVDNSRARQIPRLYQNYPESAPQPERSPRQPSQHSPDAWTKPSTAPFYPPRGRPSLSVDILDRAPESSRPLPPTLPPTLTLDRNSSRRLPSPHERHSQDYAPAPPPPAPVSQHPSQGPPSSVESSSPRYSSNYEYHSTYHTSTGHGHSLSPSPTHPTYDRAPFPPTNAYPRPYHDYSGYPELGPMSMNGDGKQRKRRGNLPKETTDKLRSWFMAHLTHPYPTEDEKQQLMRHTGLQMNQISNWFINARRRQLPTMINNARAETDAMSNSGGQRHRMHVHGKKSLALSEGGVGSQYDDDICLHRSRSVGIKRGSV